MLSALRARRSVERPVALVVAHPDDETLAAGGSLHLFRRLLLVHVTDGAPRALGDAAREGFDDPAAYAAAREAELAAALALSEASPERIALGIPDQEAADAVPAITARLRALFSAHGIETVLTHAFEGGHPDHDAVALAVSALGAATFEFAGYHAGPQGELVAQFSESTEREATVSLNASDLARKRRMLACFRTQADILSHFDPALERFRPAPAYDFSRRPSPDPLLYERWGWLTFDDWCARCAA